MKTSGYHLLLNLILFATFSVQADQGTALHKLFADEWQYRADHSPYWGELNGRTGAASELGDISPEALLENYRAYRAFNDRLAEIDRDSLSLTDQINYDVFAAEITESLVAWQYRTHLMPLTSENSFHTYLAGLHRRARFGTAADYDNYLARLSQIPAHFEQQIAYMTQGLKEGITQPAVIIGHYPDSIRAMIHDDPTQSEYYVPFRSMPSRIDAADIERLQQRARTVISEGIIPAHRTFLSFMQEKYLPGARKSIAAYDLPDGKAFYATQIRQYTTLDLTAEQIHQIGLEEVKRIRAEMEDIIEQVGFEGSFAEFLEFLRTDPQFYATSAEDLIREASYISKRMDGQLPKLFTRFPRQPYTVNPVPEAIAPNYTTGRYVSAPLDSDRPGQYWVNTYALDKRPLYNLEALTFHEAVPGHHFQNALAAELGDLPNFRRHYYISAFGEGWGLYSEWLGKEVGFYTDPYSDFGRLTYEMWRAMRLVVDTGMHAMGMSRDEAIRLMEENTALSKHNVRTEIDRYIGWPAQALSYKLGEIRIRELRARAESELGERFDLRRFHDALLENGSVPLAVLEQLVDRWIASQQGQANG